MLVTGQSLLLNDAAWRRQIISERSTTCPCFEVPFMLTQSHRHAVTPALADRSNRASTTAAWTT